MYFCTSKACFVLVSKKLSTLALAGPRIPRDVADIADVADVAERTGGLPEKRVDTEGCSSAGGGGCLSPYIIYTYILKN